MDNYKMLAKTFEGLEEVLAKELTDIGAQNVQILRRAVSFEGDVKVMYEANLWVRTAISILKPIATFKAENEQELYDGVYAIKWFEYFDVGKTFSIDTVLVNSNITHTKFAAYKAKDAIADQFRYYFNQRPDVGRQEADIFINVYISNNECIISLNSSGTPLFKRGYRQLGHRAPLNETLAAGLIKLSGWDMNSNFIDPMCGSGTLLVEAALMAYNFPPAFLREEFSFMNWTNYDPTIWRELKTEVYSKQKDFEYKIIGGDISASNLQIAREIITGIKFHKDIELVNCDIIDLQAPDNGKKGWLVSNPPYGERLKPEDLMGLYEKIGTALKHNFAGYSAWIISSDMEALKSIGLKTSKKIPLLNGALECRFNAYELYEGTKKIPKENIEEEQNLAVVDTKTEEESVIANSEEISIERQDIAAPDTSDNEVSVIANPETNGLLFDLYVSNKIDRDRESDNFSGDTSREWKDKKDFKPRGDRPESGRREWKDKKDFKPRGNRFESGRKEWKDKSDFKPRGDRSESGRREWKDKKDFKPRGDRLESGRREWKDKKDFKPRGDRPESGRREWKDKKDFKPRGDRPESGRREWKDKKDFKPRGDRPESGRRKRKRKD